MILNLPEGFEWAYQIDDRLGFRHIASRAFVAMQGYLGNDAQERIDYHCGEVVSGRYMAKAKCQGAGK